MSELSEEERAARRLYGSIASLNRAIIQRQHMNGDRAANIARANTLRIWVADLSKTLQEMDIHLGRVR